MAFHIYICRERERGGETVNLPVVLFNILLCVDSKAGLYSLNSTDSKVRSDNYYR